MTAGARPRPPLRGSPPNGMQGLSSWLGPTQCGARRKVMELDVCLAVIGGHDEVPAGKQPGMALAIVLDPASLVAQREPATPGELDLEDRSPPYQPTGEEVAEAGAAAAEP